MFVTPGLYLVDLETRGMPPADVLLRGLESMGWSDVALDRSSGSVVRFVGRLERPIQTVDTERVRWAFVSPLPVDVFGPMRLLVYPFELIEGRTYALWIMARMRSHEKRPDVEKGLAREGFELVKLAELKNNTRLPGRPTASVSFWCAIGVWRKPSTFVNTDLPFYFEAVTEMPT